MKFKLQFSKKILRCHHYNCVSAFVRNINTLPKCCERHGVNCLNGVMVWYYDVTTNVWMLDFVLLNEEPLNIKFANYWTGQASVSHVTVKINIFCNTHANKDLFHNNTEPNIQIKWFTCQMLYISTKLRSSWKRGKNIKWPPETGFKS